ncbi:uncharacterized protein LOC131614856 [Vicia villosa]|uniref:uncharacterized protein LOC131614856 n=1 Tax=Vicia villosa TaxID=3911 RepID=UPI00273AC906|nr:uncharacterized protein LOC131614856 [Vicia villosa]
MAGRNDAAIAAALEAMAEAMHTDENARSRSLATFQRENPPVFKGTHDPEGALTWMKEVERIFRVMDCTQEQKVRLEAAGEEISWAVFKREFLRKYYPEDVRGKKETEFLALVQGNRSVSEYAKAVGYQKIRVFPDLVDSCRIFDEDNNAHYKVINEKRNKGPHNRGKPYDRGKADVCTDDVRKCYKCGRVRHISPDCTFNGVVCFHCGEEGHMSAADCVRRLGLVLSDLGGEMVIDLPAMGSVTTSLVCENCPVSIFSKDFTVDLICLPMHELNVVLGMDWLMSNRVHIDCYQKLVRFPFLERDAEVGVLSTKELNLLLADGAHLFGLFASLTVESRAAVGDFPVVCEFPEVFPEDFSDVPPKREEK